MPARRPLAERWAEKVTKTEDHWLWTAATNGVGYGVIGSGVGKQMVYAHRVSYELHVGPIPAGMELDHLCRVPRCVRPDHLEVVTHKTNTLRGVSPAALNARATVCVRGHDLSGTNVHVGPSRRRECRACWKIENAERWAKRGPTSPQERERQRLATAKYRQAHLDERRAADRKWHWDHREERTAYMRAHYHRTKALHQP